MHMKPDVLTVEGKTSTIQSTNKHRRKKKATIDSDDETLGSPKNKVLRVMLPKLQDGYGTHLDAGMKGSDSITNVLSPWTQTQRASQTFLNFGNVHMRNTPVSS